MSGDHPIRRLRRQTAEAIDAHQRSQTSREQIEPHPAVPGDLFVLPATAKLSVEWAALHCEPDQRRAFVVPADTHPLLGGGDIAVGPEAGGPLQLRCRFGAWIQLDALRRSLRSGTLTPAIVEQARAALDPNTTPTVGDPATESDPHYIDWVNEVLLPACAAIAALAPNEETGEAGPANGS